MSNSSNMCLNGLNGFLCNVFCLAGSRLAKLPDEGVSDNARALVFVTKSTGSFRRRILATRWDGSWVVVM